MTLISVMRPTVLRPDPVVVTRLVAIVSVLLAATAVHSLIWGAWSGDATILDRTLPASLGATALGFWAAVRGITDDL